MFVILRINLSNEGKDTKYGKSETEDKGLGLFRIKREKKSVNCYILMLNQCNKLRSCLWSLY